MWGRAGACCEGWRSTRPQQALFPGIPPCPPWTCCSVDLSLKPSAPAHPSRRTQIKEAEAEAERAADLRYAAEMSAQLDRQEAARQALLQKVKAVQARGALVVLGWWRVGERKGWSMRAAGHSAPPGLPAILPNLPPCRPAALPASSCPLPAEPPGGGRGAAPARQALGGGGDH